MTEIPLPGSRKAAELLHDAGPAGRLVSAMPLHASPETDPLAALIAAVKADARIGGLTDEQIDAELAVYNAERRI